MVNRTATAIIHAFNRLIEDCDFQKISVDMIMQEAQVSRSTFYRYFKDKYDVMNANYKHILDYYIAPEHSKNYRDLCYHLFSYAQKHLKIFRRAFNSTGLNSLGNFIYEYSYQTALNITQANRGGAGFTPAEELQVDVFCTGIYAVYRNIVYQRYQLSASDAADALYEMMPESLKYYWWPETV